MTNRRNGYHGYGDGTLVLFTTGIHVPVVMQFAVSVVTEVRRGRLQAFGSTVQVSWDARTSSGWP
ncbi:hypothetical protein OHA79_44085 [Streptomyces sp. NBC_00841]|uniref:hypothetical protein n=1 Tax=unclassified Streptomyces TaxID=2593676 RepID=UPI002257F74D|nr:MULTISPECIES: hypothetical protein [unclassified Streptomyces]MCX4530063.1 hypothetical protein [Streptomyces sp. NBC_01669]WSA04145.1 hypothetical protein OHA79_44085 [Streptomyces sp. NBC_00841]